MIAHSVTLHLLFSIFFGPYRALLGNDYRKLIFAILISGIMEPMKQLSWSDTRAKLYHFRFEGGDEVDVVLQSGDGRIVGIECKAAIRLASSAFKGLKALKELAGEKFHRGIVLYAGSEILTFEGGFEAVPASALWETFSGTSHPLSSWS